MKFGVLKIYISSRALNIIQRIICFERKAKAHIIYKWKFVWDALFQVTKFISTPEMFQNKEIIQIGTEVSYFQSFAM